MVVKNWLHVVEMMAENNDYGDDDENNEAKPRFSKGQPGIFSLPLPFFIDNLKGSVCSL